MPLAKPLETLRKELNELLVDDLVAALRQLQQLLPENSDKQQLATALLGRFNAANKERLRGTISNDELQRLYNQVRADLLDLIAGLSEADFDAATAHKAGADGKPAPRQGSVLYRVPHQMPLDKETKCVVRIALEEEAIVENITLDEHVQLKSLYRVSDTMQAEIIDPSGGQVFRIRSTSEPVQLIDEQGFTEWRFYVTPLHEGSFPLEIKVSVIEMLHNLPCKKEIVLEETVQVVTESPAPADTETPMKTAGYALAFGNTAGLQPPEQESGSVPGRGVPPPPFVAPGPASAIPVPPAPQPLVIPEYPTPQASAPRKSTGGLRTLAFFLAFLMLGSATTWALTPPETRAWWVTRYVTDTPQAYQEYAGKFPKSKYRDEAIFRRAERMETVRAFREYQSLYPQGKYREKVAQRLEQLEIKALQRVQTERSGSAVRQFLDDFPESPRLEEVRKTVEQKEELKRELLPAIEQRIDQRQQRREERKSGASPAPDSNASDPGLSANPVPETEQEAFTSAERKGGPEAFEAFLQKHPQGELADRARAHLQALRTDRKAIRPEMVFVKGGTFKMGDENNGPIHDVALSDFYIGKYEVTFDEYDRFCEATGRQKPNDEGWGRGKRPVIYVSWFDAVAYCNWLSKQEGLPPVYKIAGDGVVFLSGRSGYCLPAEAEWEYAARGGNRRRDFLYSGSNDLGVVAWHNGNSGGKTHPAGQKKGNALRLFDMSGNVCEWCGDWYGNYPAQAQLNPAGPDSGKERCVRGSSQNVPQSLFKITNRFKWDPNKRDIDIGFRIARH